ncbi:MAG: hypothetical protein NC238_13950, partial [Dehalobacter sp.]|nr:hypothetical protein [Dehalobacter sp.]
MATRFTVTFPTIQNGRDLLTRSFLLWERPLPAGLLTFIIFLGISATAGSPWRLSGFPYFNYLADAFLHGQLNLRIVPADTLDLSLFEGKYFLYWGPLPAVFAMPLVAVFGPSVSDVIQSVFFGAIDVGLFSQLLRLLNEKGIINLSPIKRAFVVVFFALGTPFTPLPAAGTVWFLLQVETLAFVLLGFIAALSLERSKAFFVTGTSISAILLLRPSAAISYIFLVWFLIKENLFTGRRNIFRYCLLGFIPIFVTLVALVLYNYFRFGNIMENGLSYHLMGEVFQETYLQYGLFNLHYFPNNFFSTYLFYPIDFEAKTITPLGGSLYLLSPLFVGSIFALWYERKEITTWILFFSVLVGNIPILFLMGPGGFQYGPRYTLDFSLPLLMLTAIGIKRWSPAIIVLMLIISVFHYLIGALFMVYV